MLKEIGLRFNYIIQVFMGFEISKDCIVHVVCFQRDLHLADLRYVLQGGLCRELLIVPTRYQVCLFYLKVYSFRHLSHLPLSQPMIIAPSFVPPHALHSRAGGVCRGDTLKHLSRPSGYNLQVFSGRISFRPRSSFPLSQPRSSLNLLPSLTSTFVFNSLSLLNVSLFIPIRVQFELSMPFSESLKPHQTTITAVTRILRFAAVAGVLPLLPTRTQAYRERRSTR